MVYNSAKTGDHGFLVTGVNNRELYGLNGFTEQQAREVAFHLNAAFDAGQREMQASIKKVLGVSA